MRAFLIFTTIIAVAVARPDIGLELQEPKADDEVSSRGNFGGAGAAAGAQSGAAAGGAARYIDNGVKNGQTRVIDIGGPAGERVIVKPVVVPAAPTIHKHFYIHEAPEEEKSAPKIQEKQIPVSPEKHYKIIFIKTPSSDGAGAGGNTAVFPQREEKTIVYVLSKKPDGGITEAADFPEPPPAVISEPEVYFVKYRTSDESDDAIAKIQESFLDGGAGYNSPEAFAQSIGAAGGAASNFGIRADDSEAAEIAEAVEAAEAVDPNILADAPVEVAEAE